MCQSHTGRLTGFWFLLNRPKGWILMNELYCYVLYIAHLTSRTQGIYLLCSSNNYNVCLDDDVALISCLRILIFPARYRILWETYPALGYRVRSCPVAEGSVLLAPKAFYSTSPAFLALILYSCNMTFFYLLKHNIAVSDQHNAERVYSSTVNRGLWWLKWLWDKTFIRIILDFTWQSSFFRRSNPRSILWQSPFTLHWDKVGGEMKCSVGIKRIFIYYV